MTDDFSLLQANFGTGCAVKKCGEEHWCESPQSLAGAGSEKWDRGAWRKRSVRRGRRWLPASQVQGVRSWAGYRPRGPHGEAGRWRRPTSSSVPCPLCFFCRSSRCY